MLKKLISRQPCSWILMLVVAFWSFGMLWVCGAVMRESDQASLLSGALQLSREVCEKPNFHNYSGQYGSYWLLGLLQRFFTIESLKGYVSWGNYIACATFLLGLLGYISSVVIKKENLRCAQVILIIISLTSPAVILSAPLLSSNILAGGAVLALISTRGLWEKKGGAFIGSALVFCAVSLRQDAAFLLPLICFIPQKVPDFLALLRRKYFWSFLLSALFAVGLGKFISPSSYLPELVLDWKLIGCYGFFGLLGAGIVIFWGGLNAVKVAKGFVTKAVLLVAILCPTLMYVFLLYSPRHLFMACLIPLLLAVSSWIQEENKTEAFFKRKGFRSFTVVALGLALIVNVFWLTLAPKVQGDGTVKWDVKDATCYPTADGLWPIGGGLHFLHRLKNANREYEAIDHNQEVWGAWEDWKVEGDLNKYVFSSTGGVNAYMYLWSRFYGGQSPDKGGKIALDNHVSNGRQLIIGNTDREMAEVGNRGLKSLQNDKVQRSELFSSRYLASTSRGRLIFLSPRVVKTDLFEEIYLDRLYLMEKHPKKEFLSVLKRKQDGHLYVELGGRIYRSNYPEIFLKYF